MFAMRFDFPNPAIAGTSMAQRYAAALDIAEWADPKAGWALMAPYFLHETNAYGKWLASANMDAPFHVVADADELRAGGQYRVITPEEFVA